MKKYFTLIILLLTGITGCSQDSKPTEIHGSYRKAIQLLQQSKKQLPADSLLIEKEYNRVLRAYANVSDSLKNHAPESSFIGFETQRLINLCYAAESIEKLQHQQRNLFKHLGKHQDKLPNPDSIHNEVAKCIVNSYEKQSIWFEDTLLHYVTTAMQQHLNSLDAESWKPGRKQAFVNMYAAQYYKRGIVSMAEPVFRHFRRFYQYEKTSAEQLLLSENYRLYSSDLKPTEKKIGQLIKGKSMLLFVNEESPLNLIYLIKFIRTAPQSFPSTPVVVLWDDSAVSSAYMKALRRNLSKPKYYIAGLSDKDCKSAEKYASFTAQGKNGKLQIATNNPIDFQEWLEKPLAKQMQYQKEKLIKNYEKLQARKKRQENLPRDSSLKYQIQEGKLKVECRGYWDFNPNLKVKQYAFTQSSQGALKSQKQMVKLEVYQEHNPIYSVNFISEGNPVEITLTAGPQHSFSASFKDKENRIWNRLSRETDSLMQKSQVYNHLINNYPFSKSEFIQKLSSKQREIQNLINDKIDSTLPLFKPLVELRTIIIKLNSTEPAKEIGFNDINKYYPTATFDSVIWRSPLYGNWIDSWMLYGSKDMVNAIDQAFGYWKVVPEAATEEVGQYIWDRLNAMGRFDALVHLDTTWLAGCKGEENPDVRKRIEGYKRMAPGKKAPNISWESKGKTKDLYSLKADTVMVVFWSDDCSYCKEKLPKLYQKYSDSKHAEVIAVAVDKDDSSLKAGKKFMPNWHHVWAEDGWEDDLIELYNVFGTPEMYILDGDFKIIRKSI
ncbi:MAG: TlpA family protein disulfide reductase [Bacteroidales bacterium]|nr:TlpA family protein disulfide reductase [Bacteroidales bacterium]